MRGRFEYYKQTLSLRKKRILKSYKNSKRMKFNVLKKTVYKKYDNKKLVTNLNDEVKVIHTKFGKELRKKRIGEIK